VYRHCAILYLLPFYPHSITQRHCRELSRDERDETEAVGWRRQVNQGLGCDNDRLVTRRPLHSVLSEGRDIVAHNSHALIRFAASFPASDHDAAVFILTGSMMVFGVSFGQHPVGRYLTGFGVAFTPHSTTSRPRQC